MGRKAGMVRINPKKFASLNKPCMKEMITFLNCLALNHNNDNKCVWQKELLGACMDAQHQSSLEEAQQGKVAAFNLHRCCRQRDNYLPIHLRSF